MVFLILSRDVDLVAEVKAMLEGTGCAVYVAASATETRRIEEEADVEMVVWDPVMEVR